MVRNQISHIRFYRPGPRARLAPKGRADTSLPIPIEEIYPVRRNKGPLTRFNLLLQDPDGKHVYACLRRTYTQHSNNWIQTRGGRPPHALRQTPSFPPPKQVSTRYLPVPVVIVGS
mgnify:CR=1 FL=1|jgi:hypothetical protein